ncbi:MAG TPA: VOC family protein [Pseudomonadales bacterium]|nr:VOC family protein [Pseudomonadales bacterium]
MSRKAFMPVLLAVLFSVHTHATQLTGKFVWAELVTDDLAVATRFYAGLFGWTFEEVDGYATAYNHDEPVAGLFYYPRAKSAAGKPRWFGYISVADVQKTGQSILAAGGKVRAPLRKLPGQDGDAMVFADPEGALFGVVHFAAGDPVDYLAETGDWIWIQLLSRDVHKAGSFYQHVANYELIKNGHANGADQFLLSSEGYARAAVMAISPKRRDVTPCWIPSLRVDNVAATIARAQQLGGTVLVPPRPDLFAGRAAVIADPTGGAVGIMEWDEQTEDAP